MSFSAWLKTRFLNAEVRHREVEVDVRGVFDRRDVTGTVPRGARRRVERVQGAPSQRQRGVGEVPRSDQSRSRSARLLPRHREPRPADARGRTDCLTVVDGHSRRRREYCATQPGDGVPSRAQRPARHHPGHHRSKSLNERAPTGTPSAPERGKRSRASVAPTGSSRTTSPDACRGGFGKWRADSN